MKLVKMTDFVLQIEAEVEKEDYQVVAWQTKIHGYSRINKYARFLKKPLTLGMFIPCDDDGNVLNKPKFFYTEENIKKLKDVEIEIALSKNKEVENYKEAKSKVLFKGFEYKKELDNNYTIFIDNNYSDYKFLISFCLIQKKIKFINSIELNIKTIEDLIPYSLDLSVSF